MKEWILDNYTWLFSGAGIFLISLIITLVIKKRKKLDSQQNNGGKMNNNVNARNVNINQTIVSNISNDKGDTPNQPESKSSKNTDKDIERIKEEYVEISRKIRTELVKKLEATRNDNSTLKVHHMTDVMEEKFEMSHELVTSELEKLEEDGLIKLVLRGDETISPYTEIRVTTSRLFESL